MPQLVLDVGNCGPDHAAIRQLVEQQFDAELRQADRAEDALQALEQDADAYCLIMVNRKLDCDYSDGMRVIESLKQHDRFGKIPVMMITNFAEHQKAAVAAGAVPGFGKNALGDPATKELLGSYLSPRSVV